MQRLVFVDTAVLGLFLSIVVCSDSGFNGQEYPSTSRRTTVPQKEDSLRKPRGQLQNDSLLEVDTPLIEQEDLAQKKSTFDPSMLMLVERWKMSGSRHLQLPGGGSVRIMDLLVQTETTLRISCNVTGSLQPGWNGSDVRISVKHDGTLEIRDFSMQDVGLFVCADTTVADCVYVVAQVDAYSVNIILAVTAGFVAFSLLAETPDKQETSSPQTVAMATDWVVTGSVLGTISVLCGAGLVLAVYCKMARKQPDNIVPLRQVNNMVAGQIVDNISNQQAGISQNTQADDQEGCGNGHEKDLDSHTYETIPDKIEPYARSPYVFDVQQCHLGEVETTGKTSHKENEGTSSLPNPNVQASDHTTNNADLCIDVEVDNQVPKSDTQSCMEEVSPNLIEPYARSPYVFDVPQYHLGEVETAGKTSRKTNEGVVPLTDPDTQICDPEYLHIGEVTDDDRVDNQSQKSDNDQFCMHESTPNTIEPYAKSRHVFDVYQPEPTGHSREGAKTYGLDDIDDQS
uniref:Ig-like domain-containing protein n=1 Tax=Branchiostoma floridae TaxID=7739 RepID=C3ZNG9_BRAFL|eukprot:XP_002589911.1 hypothetical protein BRAFLDRAFT_81961 [Branchiostoma floridae]